jgi:hypothetical protein
VQVKRVEVNRVKDGVKDPVVVWVKDSQDHSHPEQACQCVVSVVHLGWGDPVPVVVHVNPNRLTETLLPNNNRDRDLHIDPVSRHRELVVAQECREGQVTTNATCNSVSSKRQGVPAQL